METEKSWNTIKGIASALVCIILCWAAGENLYLLENMDMSIGTTFLPMLVAILIGLAVLVVGTVASVYFFSKTDIRPHVGMLLTILLSVSGGAMALAGELSVLTYISNIFESELIWINYAALIFVSAVYLSYLWFIPLRKAGIFE